MHRRNFSIPVQSARFHERMFWLRCCGPSESNHGPPSPGSSIIVYGRKSELARGLSPFRGASCKFPRSPALPCLHATSHWLRRRPYRHNGELRDLKAGFPSSGRPDVEASTFPRERHKSRTSIKAELHTLPAEADSPPPPPLLPQ